MGRKAAQPRTIAELKAWIDEDPMGAAERENFAEESGLAERLRKKARAQLYRREREERSAALEALFNPAGISDRELLDLGELFGITGEHALRQIKSSILYHHTSLCKRGPGLRSLGPSVELFADQVFEALLRDQKGRLRAAPPADATDVLCRVLNRILASNPLFSGEMVRDVMPCLERRQVYGSASADVLRAVYSWYNELLRCDCRRLNFVNLAKRCSLSCMNCGRTNCNLSFLHGDEHAVDVSHAQYVLLCPYCRLRFRVDSELAYSERYIERSSAAPLREYLLYIRRQGHETEVREFEAMLADPSYEPLHLQRPKFLDFPLLEGEGALTESQWLAIIVAQDGKCAGCGKPDIDALTIDHVVPRSKGGSDRADNIQGLCLSCNSAKGVKMDWHYRSPEAPGAHGEVSSEIPN